MIRTALTLNISQHDARTQAFLVNGTHLGLLSSSRQHIHVQNSHRPLQLVAAFSLGPESREGLDSQAKAFHQQRLLESWQAFAQLLSRRGSSELADLLRQYQLKPDWLICLDQQRLQAWLPEENSLYLYRQAELRKMKAIEPKDPEKSNFFSANMAYYAFNMQLNDHFLLLPPELMDFFAQGEIAEIISGLQQLPVKMSELFSMARLRGFENEHTWFAIQVQAMEPDHQIPDDRSFWQLMQARFIIWAKTGFRKPPATVNPDESVSESLGQADKAENRAKTAPAAKTPSQENGLQPYQFGLIIALPIVILALIMMFIFWPFGSEPTDESNETTIPVTTTTVAEPTATPSPSPTPVPTQEPEVRWLIVSVNRLNFREEPSRSSRLILTLNRNDRLQQLAEPEDDWVYVMSEDGREGYVYYPYVEEVDTDTEDLDDQD